MSEAPGLTETNPLRQALPRARVPEPCALVLFGATGDLTHRLLLPSLYNLKRANLLPEDFALIGVARSKASDAEWRKDLGATLKKSMSGKSAGKTDRTRASASGPPVETPMATILFGAPAGAGAFSAIG